jgi:hypothetical protein
VTLQVGDRRFRVMFERGAQNWCAYVPSLPGCVAGAQSLGEMSRSSRDGPSGSTWSPQGHPSSALLTHRAAHAALAG